MKNFKFYLLLVSIFFISCKTVETVPVQTKPSASELKSMQGGMWIPSLLEGMNEQEMTALGSKLTAKDIYDINNSSLKDAIGHFNGGCTSEVISSKGLLLTNHHCGFSQIQSHSSLENDYIKNGFWAMSLDEELPNDGLYVEFIVRIEDVTSQIIKGVSDSMTERERQSKIDGNSNTVQKAAAKEEWQDTKVKAFYKGNQYFLFVTERYNDIRLVGAPPASIGKFGSDTDNWVFPRHTGDFSIFRIYADKNNRPAEYSKDNVPFTPKHFLPVSLDGVEEGDFTMVFGFPGSTNEYLPAVAIEQITQKVNPSNIAIRKAALNVMDKKMKADEVYEHLIYDDEQHQSVCLFPDLKSRSFITASFGKTFHNTGWKMGYCCAPKDLMDEFIKIHQFNVFSVNHPMQIALAEYLKNEDKYLQLSEFYQKKRDLFLGLMKDSRFKFNPSKGTYFQQ